MIDRHHFNGQSNGEKLVKEMKTAKCNDERSRCWCVCPCVCVHYLLIQNIYFEQMMICAGVWVINKEKKNGDANDNYGHDVYMASVELSKDLNQNLIVLLNSVYFESHQRCDCQRQNKKEHFDLVMLNIRLMRMHTKRRSKSVCLWIQRGISQFNNQ